MKSYHLTSSKYPTNRINLNYRLNYLFDWKPRSWKDLRNHAEKSESNGKIPTLKNGAFNRGRSSTLYEYVEPRNVTFILVQVLPIPYQFSWTLNFLERIRSLTDTRTWHKPTWHKPSQHTWHKPTWHKLKKIIKLNLITSRFHSISIWSISFLLDKLSSGRPIDQRRDASKAM